MNRQTIYPKGDIVSEPLLQNIGYHDREGPFYLTDLKGNKHDELYLFHNCVNIALTRRIACQDDGKKEGDPPRAYMYKILGYLLETSSIEDMKIMVSPKDRELPIGKGIDIGL